MPLPQLLTIPRDDRTKALFSFSHDQDHRAIVQLLNMKFGLTLEYFPLDPIPANTDQWEEWHQQMHSDMTGALGLQSVNLLKASFDMIGSMEMNSWIYQNFSEHSAVHQALGL